MMHSAMIVVTKPEGSVHDGTNQAWEAFLGKLNEKASVKPRQINKEAGVSVLAENVWLVDFKENPNALSRLMFHADSFGLPYGVLQFDEPPKWIPAGFTPKVTS